MEYQNEFNDIDGYIHSIDMVTIDYYLRCSYTSASERILGLFDDVIGFDRAKHSSLDNRPNFKYQYYVDMVWFDGIVVYLGKYVNYDKVDKSWTKLDSLRLKVNPNKHLNGEIMNRILGFIKEWCASGELVRYDYAVDIPCEPSEVLVIGTRKEKGLYKGTRYFGQRHKHGYCKIYNKTKEQDLDYDLTRIEYTFCPDIMPTMDNIVIRAPVASQSGDLSLSKTLRLYLDMLTEIQALGGNIESYIERMDFKTYKKIEPFLYAGKRLQLNQTILDDLISKINDIFIIDDVEQKINRKSEVKTDEDGFMVELGTNLPFD